MLISDWVVILIYSADFLQTLHGYNLQGLSEMLMAANHAKLTYVCGSKNPPFELPSEIYKPELETIRERRKAVNLPPPPETDCDNPKPRAKHGLIGLALSGGGIRSAIFSLGVMQALAAMDFLKYVDYLSTVSGGGYIGGSLTWLLSADAQRRNPSNPFGTRPGNFPYGVENPRVKRLRNSNEPAILRHLRQHGNYLAPGGGIDLISFVAIILRGILLNLVVWLPILVSVMIVALFTSHALSLAISDGLSWQAVQNVTADTLEHGNIGALLLLLAGLAAVVFLGACLIYSLLTWFRIEEGRYSARRLFESWIRWPLLAAVGFVVLGSLPYAHDYLGEQIRTTGTASLLVGLGAGLWSFVKSGTKGEGKVPLSVLVPIASFLLLYGLALTTYWIAFLYFEGPVFRWALLIALGISLVTGFCANLNYISVHRYYRDRLMETFMPDPNKAGTTGPAAGANKAELSKMWSTQAAHAPYHILNTNVVLVDSKDRRLRLRGGDNFILSPRFSGSTATGWTTTEKYTHTPMTLPTAVAISGAAANPNTGVGGQGPTRNKLLSLLMSLLNVRLGIWIPHPGRRPLFASPNHFHAARYELSPNGYQENQKFLQISDGGHFENLALYELVRRRVKLIICCDGGADPGFRFEDLQILVRRIGADFGARIKFDKDNHLEWLIPREPDPEKVRGRDPATDAYPVGVKFAKRGYILGKIIYPSPEPEGTLILLKTTMIKGLGLTLKGYKGKHPDFPDESTADQFFDEEQFEAYRELGYEIAKRLTEDKLVDLVGLLDGCVKQKPSTPQPSDPSRRAQMA